MALFVMGPWHLPKGAFNSLEELTISKCPSFNNDFRRLQKGSLPNLKSLAINDCPKFDEKNIKDIWGSFPNLFTISYPGDDGKEIVLNSPIENDYEYLKGTGMGIDWSHLIDQYRQKNG